ncbi:hypothetical protein [Streptomyces sp. AD55]
MTADVVLASAVWYLLHVQPQVDERVAVAVGVVLLRCVRINRAAGSDR